MSPAGDHVLPGGPGREPGRPAGLLEKLLAAVRPEFRPDVLAFGPGDPVSVDRPARSPDAGAPAVSGGCAPGTITVGGTGESRIVPGSPLLPIPG